MSLNIRNFEEDRDEPLDANQAALLSMERLRTAAKRTGAGRGKQKMSLFWQVFGGTIISLVALVILTAYGQLTSMQTDLRRDLNHLQVDQVKKDEFNARLTVIWNSIKSLQDTSASLLSLNEHARTLDEHVGNQLKSTEEQSRDLQRRIEDVSQRLQSLAERLVALEATQRVSKGEAETGRRGYSLTSGPLR